jgi:hypothetical protein
MLVKLRIIPVVIIKRFFLKLYENGKKLFLDYKPIRIGQINSF